MSDAPGGFEHIDYRQQLRQKMKASRAAARQAAPPPPTAVDPLRARLEQELARSRGEAPATAPDEGTPPDFPVGAGQYRAGAGDCVNSIAFEHGFYPDTIWNDAGNSELREKRKNMDTLFPGDLVTIPEKRRRDETCGAEQRHRFKRKGYPKVLRIQLKRLDRPLGNKPYQIQIDRSPTILSGVTDASGYLSVSIPPNAMTAHLFVGDNQYTLLLGHLRPVDTTYGIQQRLAHLNLYHQTPNGTMDAATIAALKSFQREHDLEVTGKPDEATKAALVQVTGETLAPSTGTVVTSRRGGAQVTSEIRGRQQ